MLLGLALSLSLPLANAAETTNENVRSLSLKDCVDMALAHNLDVQIERYSPQIANYTLRAAYGAFDPALGLTAQRTWDDEPPQFNPKKYGAPPGTPVQVVNNVNQIRDSSEYELTVDSVGPSLAGRLPSGLSYNLFGRSDHLNATTFPTASDRFTLAGVGILNPPPYRTNDYYATVGVTLRQPLLKDFWIDSYREGIQLKKKNLQISELALKDGIMTIVTTVTVSYYNLVFAREQVLVEKQALELAKQLLEETTKKFQAGTLTELDQTQAEADLETIQTAVFAAEQNYTQQENTLKNLITENYQPWMMVQIVPTENLTPVADLPPNRAVTWVNALSQRPDLLQMRLSLEKQDIVLRFTHNQLFPSLDLIGSYGWQAVDRSLSSSMGDIRDGTNPYYSVGVVFSIPLGNVTARNEHKASQLAKKQLVLSYKRLENKIITEVDTAVKLTETNFKQIASTGKAREFADAALAAARKEYEAGTKTSFWVLEAQRNLTRAKSAEIRALADYNIALAKLAMSEGTTLERRHIEIKTGK